MKKLFGLIAGLSFAVAAPIASAFPDPLYLQPEIGGAETTLAVQADNARINSTNDSDAFWYAGTGGYPSR
jgi:hypothetical protein